MATEIERKYRVVQCDRSELTDGEWIDQGYLAHGEMTIRVRTKGTKAFLTIKAAPLGEEKKPGEAIVREEFEYEIPVEDAKALLNRCAARLTKTRYYVHGLEVDVFEGAHEGLIIAEYESQDGAHAVLPKGWQWEEVSTDRRYSNSWMSRFGIPGDEEA